MSNDDYGARIIRTTSQVDMDELELRISRMVQGAVAEAVSEALRGHALSPEERGWIAKAMRSQARREERREKMYTAIVEKSITGMLFAGLAGLVLLFVEWAKNHGYKP